MHEGTFAQANSMVIAFFERFASAVTRTRLFRTGRLAADDNAVLVDVDVDVGVVDVTATAFTVSITTVD